jgi:ORF6N domain
MKNAIVQEVIERKIYLIRGHKVMLDSDLATLYGIETYQLTRNSGRVFEMPNWQVKKRR